MNDDDKFHKFVQDEVAEVAKKLTIGEIRTYADLPVTITHSQPAPREAVEETCRHCYFWRAQFGYTTRGKCTLDEEDDGPVDVLVYGDCPHEVITSADWYCKGYQRRPDGGE